MIVDWTGWLFLPLEKFSHWTLKFLRFSNSWSWIFVCFMCIFTIYSFSRIFPLLLDVTTSNQICRGGRVIFTILTENFRKRTDILRRPNGQRDCGMHVFCPKQAISKDVLISKEGRTKFLAISYNLRFLFSTPTSLFQRRDDDYQWVMNGAVKLQNNGELETVSSFNPKEEFEKRRWVLITNVPDGVDLEVRYRDCLPCEQNLRIRSWKLLEQALKQRSQQP